MYQVGLVLVLAAFVAPSSQQFMGNNFLSSMPFFSNSAQQRPSWGSFGRNGGLSSFFGAPASSNNFMAQFQQPQAQQQPSFMSQFKPSQAQQQQQPSFMSQFQPSQAQQQPASFMSQFQTPQTQQQPSFMPQFQPPQTQQQQQPQMSSSFYNMPSYLSQMQNMPNVNGGNNQVKPWSRTWVSYSNDKSQSPVTIIYDNGVLINPTSTPALPAVPAPVPVVPSVIQSVPAVPAGAEPAPSLPVVAPAIPPMPAALPLPALPEVPTTTVAPALIIQALATPAPFQAIDIYPPKAPSYNPMVAGLLNNKGNDNNIMASSWFQPIRSNGFSSFFPNPNEAAQSKPVPFLGNNNFFQNSFYPQLRAQGLPLAFQ